MKDKKWCRQIEEEIVDLKNRVAKLDGGPGTVSLIGKIIELDINWPETDIGGLRFNETKVHAVFEKDEDGAYYSRDILFLSERDADEGTGRDLLSEYLDSAAVREAFRKTLGYGVSVFLPEERRGVKKYHGVDWGYWLRPCYSGSAAHFCYAYGGGNAYYHAASAVGGCAPAFRAELPE